MGLPSIDFTFKKLAASAIKRSTRGILAIIVQDTTAEWSYQTYSSLLDVDADDFTEANYAAIARAFDASPYRVIVVRIGTSDDMDDAEAILRTLYFNWICTAAAGLQSGLSTYVKAFNSASRAHKIKGVVSGVTAADDEHVVNIPNTNVTLVGETSTLAINLYVPRIAGILAACPMDEAVTSWPLSDLSAVSEIADVDASIDAGNMPLYLDDNTFRISRGVNTLTTLAGGKTEDMKKITIIEAMDMMREDICDTFKESYLGRYKNKADNQALFISAVLGYFKNLAREDVLNPDYANFVDVDIEAQKAAWEAIGKDTSGWSDAEAKKKTIGSKMYLTADVQILDAIEDLKFVVQMA